MSDHDPLPPASDAVFVEPAGVTADPPPPAAPDVLPFPVDVVCPPEKPHPGFGWALLWCVGFVVFTQVPAGAVAAVLIGAVAVLDPGAVPADGDPTKLAQAPAFNAAMAVALTLAQLLGIGLSLLVLRLMAGPGWKRKVALRAPAAGHVLVALAGVPAASLIAGGAYHFFRHVLRLPSFSDWVGAGMDEMVQVFARWPWPFAVLVVGLGPGLAEELWCRGFLGRGLVGRYGPVAGVLFTSFFFGLIHVDPSHAAMAALMGLWLHFAYLATRSLWVPILLHAGNNSLAVVLPRFSGLNKFEEDPAAIPAYVFYAAYALLAAVVWALANNRARLAADGDGPAWAPAFPGVECPPPGSGTRVVSPTPPWTDVALVAGAFGAFLACAAVAVLRG